MTIEVDLPDGSTAEFPDGMNAAEIEAVLRRQFPPAPSAMQPAADLSSGVVRGAANLLDFVGTPIRAGLNVAGIPTSENPTLATLNRLGLGLPAQSDSGQFLQRVGEDVGASAIPTAGLLGAARAGVQATGLLGSAIQGARTAPAAFAGAELAAATGSGVGAATAERLAPESPAAEVLGSLIGGLSPTAATGAVRAAIRGGPAAGERICAVPSRPSAVPVPHRQSAKPAAGSPCKGWNVFSKRCQGALGRLPAAQRKPPGSWAIRCSAWRINCRCDPAPMWRGALSRKGCAAGFATGRPSRRNGCLESLMI